MKEIDEIYEDMVVLFEEANGNFIKNNKDLIESNVAERTLCGALKECIDCAKCKTEYKNYSADVEYNRNKKGVVKTIIDADFKVIKINCDLILHSRGKCVELDNLIAIEMKKSERPQAEKDSDRNRIIALTKDSYDDVWSFDGKTLPEHVCRYVLGVYYEIDIAQKTVYLEYYRRGELVKNISFAI